MLEAALDATTEEIRVFPEQLVASGRCKISANELARLTGRVYLDRNEVCYKRNSCAPGIPGTNVTPTAPRCIQSTSVTLVPPVDAGDPTPTSSTNVTDVTDVTDVTNVTDVNDAG